MAATMTDGAAAALLATIPDGSRVVVKVLHVRDTTHVRTHRGLIVKKNDHWSIMTTSTQRIKVPNDDLLIISIEVIEAANETTAAQVASANLEAPDEPEIVQPPMSQPSAEVTSMLAAALRAIEGFSRGSQVQPTQLPPPAPASEQRFDDVGRLMLMSDALRGQDNPTWRLAPGLLLHRFLPEKFLIVSIPHLLFRDNGSTGEMVRVPIGTAVQHYRSILSNCKLQFPNQVAMRAIVSKDGKQSEDGSNGVRCQIERAERMFIGLLERLDQTDTNMLPSSKNDWIIFIDVGVELLELYATLAFGFVKGGAKVSSAYSASIMTTGKFDPVKLWNDIQFRSK
jgi:hypothetical protein